MLLSDLFNGNDANFARPKGAKDKKPRKRRGQRVFESLKSGVSGAMTGGGLAWTGGELLKDLPSKKAGAWSNKLLKNVPKATRIGLGVGLATPLAKELLKKRKKRKTYAR